MRDHVSSSVSRRHVVALLAGSVAPVAPVRADDALRLVKEVFDRPVGRDLTTLSTMELTEKGKAPRIRQFVTYRLQRGKGETSNLIRFLQPKDIAGTGLLSLDHADGSNEQYLYLPALDRVRKVSGDRKRGRFVGSDLYFEDLQERAPDRDRHRLLGRETLGGVVCEVVESVPVDESDSVYLKRQAWIDARTSLVHRLDYFEKDAARPGKRWALVTSQRTQGYWLVTESIMADLSSGHETRIRVEVSAFDRKLPAKLFTVQSLGDESLESEYRP
jgi:hypothetical protein